MCYEAAPDAPGLSKPWQSREYPAMLDRVLKAGGRLIWSPFSWSELGHIIERTEWKISLACGATAAETVKAFRYENPAERERVVDAIKGTWKQVTELAEPMPEIVLNAATVEAANAELSDVMLDGYDLFMAQQLRSSALTGIITDDADFTTFPGITVFTANNRVVSEARAQDRLR
jgi:predicted nucleic acid-binding protein